MQYAGTSTCNSGQRQHSYDRVDEDHYEEEIGPTQVALESLKEEMEEVQGLMNHKSANHTRETFRTPVKSDTVDTSPGTIYLIPPAVSTTSNKCRSKVKTHS